MLNKSTTIFTTLFVLAIASACAKTSFTLAVLEKTLPYGSGGTLLSYTWQPRRAIAFDDGQILFFAPLTTQNGIYGALYKNSPGQQNPTIVHLGYMQLPGVSFIEIDNSNLWLAPLAGNQFARAQLVIDSGNAHVRLFTSQSGDIGYLVNNQNPQNLTALLCPRLFSTSSGSHLLGDVSTKPLTLYAFALDSWQRFILRDEAENPEQWKYSFTFDNWRDVAANADGSWWYYFEPADEGVTFNLRISSQESPQQLFDGFTGPLNGSFFADCSADGRIVYFTRYERNAAQIYRADISSSGHATFFRITQFPLNDYNLPDTKWLMCSEDGNSLVFASKRDLTGTTPVNEDLDFVQIYHYDHKSQRFALVSTKNGNHANADCHMPAISPNGNTITFSTNATNLGATDGKPHQYRVAKTTEPDPKVRKTISLNAWNEFVNQPLPQFACVNASHDANQINFATNLQLAFHDVEQVTLFDVYKRHIPNQTTILLSTETDISHHIYNTISGDGNTTWLDRAAMTSNYNGSICAYLENGNLYLVTKDGTQVIATDAIAPITSTYSYSKSIACKTNFHGNIVLYTAIDGLRAWFADGNENVLIAPGITDYATLSLSGRWAYYCQNGFLYRAQANAASPPEQLMTMNAICAISQNGTAVAFIDQNNEIKIIPLDAPNDEMQVESGSTIGTTGDTFAIAADASKVIYVTSNPIDEDDNNNAADLVYADIDTQTFPTAQVATNPQAVDENADPDNITTYTIDLVNDTIVDVAIRLSQDQPELYGNVQLLHPSSTSQWYQLNYTPTLNYCGDISVALELWNGSVWTPLSVTITVNNVNSRPKWKNWPAGQTLPVTEGVTYDPIPLGGWATDPDFIYYQGNQPTEVLTYSTADNAPAWATVNQDNELVIDLTEAHDAVPRGGGIVKVPLVVTDAGGLTDIFELPFSIENTNRPASIGVESVSAFEGVEIPWDKFAVGDPDQEDQENLWLCLAPFWGTIYDKTGTPAEKIAFQGSTDTYFRVKKSQFPITYAYTQPEPVINATRDAFTIWAEDVDEAWANSVLMTVELKTVAYQVAGLVRGFVNEDGELVFQELKRGWNLLASPYDLDDTAAYFECLGVDAAWKWNDVTYVVADSLQTNEGFWAYIPEVPQDIADDEIFTATRSFNPYMPIPGWNLRGQVDAAKHTSIFGFKDGAYLKSPNLLDGEGYFFFKDAK